MKEKSMKTIIMEMENRNPNNKDSIAFRLNYIIKKRRYNAKEVAALTEDKAKGLKPISPATLSLYINGKSVPNKSYIERIANVLNVDPAWLSCFLPFEWIEKPKPESEGSRQLMEIYNRLNLKGKKYLLETAKMALVSMNMANEAEENTDE